MQVVLQQTGSFFYNGNEQASHGAVYGAETTHFI